MKKLFLFTFLCCFLLIGCGDGMPPKCDSKEAKELLKDIFLEAGISNPIIANAKTLKTNNNNQSYLCQAYVNETSLLNSRFYKYSIFWQNKEQKAFYVQIVE